MARAAINLGVAPTGQGGDTYRTSCQKNNDNSSELYAALGADGQGALPAALPVTKGGTGGKTQAEAQTALGIPTTDAPLPVTKGGTGGKTQAEAQTALGIPTTDAPLPVTKGGTGGKTQAEAQTALGIPTTDAPLPVTKGGTGGKTQAEARAGLGLGTASTLAAGSAAGNVMLAGNRDSPLASTINTWGNSYQIWTSSGTLGAPEAGSFGTIINAAWPGGNYGGQILMSVTGRMFFRAGDYSSASMREVYHTGNTTKTTEGLLKAI